MFSRYWQAFTHWWRHGLSLQTGVRPGDMVCLIDAILVDTVPVYYFCLDCNAAREAANDSAEVTCSVCGGFRMDGATPLGERQEE